jgi:oxygen-dependent protoporphyrinogen oxidase
MSAPRQVVIAGAGISGLVCAHALQQGGASVRVFEAAARAGGLIRSEQREGHLLELGPQSFTLTKELRALFGALQIEDQIVPAPPRAPRFVLTGGRLRAVPLSPPGFFASSLFGLRTKWSVIRDALGHTNPPDEESVAEFVRRKFSAELLDRLVAPFVAGIYAGAPERLSLRGAFPQIYNAERTAGSIVRGMMRNARARSTEERPASVAFRNGNATLVHACAASLAGALICNAQVQSIHRAAAGQFLVRVGIEGRSESIPADDVVIALPADHAARLAQELLPDAASRLASIEYAPVAVVATAYSNAQVGAPTKGFGFLVAPGENTRLLGTVYNSFLFPGRAPAGHSLFTSFLGGARNPSICSNSADQLIAAAHEDLARVLNISGEPVFSNAVIHPRAIPQYNLGHRQAATALEAAAALQPRLHFAGNYIEGPSVGASVSRALAIAAKILAYLAR